MPKQHDHSRLREEWTNGEPRVTEHRTVQFRRYLHGNWSASIRIEVMIATWGSTFLGEGAASIGFLRPWAFFAAFSVTAASAIGFNCLVKELKCVWSIKDGNLTVKFGINIKRQKLHLRKLSEIYYICGYIQGSYVAYLDPHIVGVYPHMERHCVHSRKNDTKFTEIFFIMPRTTFPARRTLTSRFVISNTTYFDRYSKTLRQDPSTDWSWRVLNVLRIF